MTMLLRSAALQLHSHADAYHSMHSLVLLSLGNGQARQRKRLL